MSSKQNSTQKGTNFENEVKELLVLQGKNVIGEKLLGHKKVDLYFTERSFSKTYRYAVECKDYNSMLQKDDVLEIYADYSALFDSNLIDRLLIVTRLGLTPTSLEFINLKKNVEHITFTNLLNTTIDFTQYINYLYDEYENSSDGLNKYYIRLRAKENNITTDKTKDLENIIESWIDSEDYNPIAILGSYGQGKTSFSKKLSYTLSEKYLNDNTYRIPIYIKLSSISKEQSIEGLLGKILTTTAYIRNYNYHSFNQLNKAGKFVIILDGFDEMKHSLTWEEFKYNFNQLNKLVSQKSKVILLGRPNAFLSDEEHIYVLRGLKNTPLGQVRDNGWPEYSELELEPLNVEQIQQFLYNYYTLKIEIEADYHNRQKLIHARDYKSKAISDKKIRDISSRPVQLKMLADLLPYTSTPIETLTTALLYSEFIDLILDREFEKESKFNISKDDRRTFSRLVAIYLWENSNDYSIKFEEIPNELFYHFIPRGSKEIDKIKRDLISGCFLERKLGGSVYFPHKSFQEFFVADEVINRINRHNIDLSNTNALVTLEVSDFLIGLSGVKTLVSLHETIKDYYGQLSLKLLRIYIKPENKVFILEKTLSSYSPWYLLLFVLLHDKYAFQKREVSKLLEQLLKFVKATDEESFKKIYFALFLSIHNKINEGELIIKKICEEVFIYINKNKKDSSNSKQKNVNLELIENFAEIFSRINISLKSMSIDLRGLSQLFLKYLEKWCFVSEWINDKIINTGEYQMTLQLKNVSQETIYLLTIAKDEIVNASKANTKNTIKKR